MLSFLIPFVDYICITAASTSAPLSNNGSTLRHSAYLIVSSSPSLSSSSKISFQSSMIWLSISSFADAIFSPIYWSHFPQMSSKITFYLLSFLDNYIKFVFITSTETLVNRCWKFSMKAKGQKRWDISKIYKFVLKNLLKNKSTSESIKWK